MTASADRLGVLLARHGRIMSLRLRQALESCGFGLRHGNLLMHLAQAGATSQQALIETLALDASAVVATLNDLERDGLVERRRDPADRRRHIVEITADGVKRARAAAEAIDEVEREAFGDLDDTETAQLHALLIRVRTRFDESACAAD
ncbi:DNA-binding MarR family transcriptional regulator [Allocatelliglobosispora scoriae]|uniref:DNA-binding MarR family transcriptional regulator n=1 Tax=Allocatelliglobosispora scoriae TaxID=643052 RepID=A0A841BIS4_9ACTN|nr:MarR family winged helix-turn-helix transcriptional regulator [Allocatelliglobosispora scoriae]MBB5868164.1 DNA-binding MarR family transcriptional regulator [Allocatelliglobosispora scoriae]